MIITTMKEPKIETHQMKFRWIQMDSIFAAQTHDKVHHSQLIPIFN